MKIYYKNKKVLVRVAVVLAVACLVLLLGFQVLAKDGEKVLIIAREFDAQNLDPYVATSPTGRQIYYGNILEGLLYLTREQRIEPLLAASWEEVDSTSYRFHLRKGIKFHDGSPFNAEAVKFCFDRLFGYLEGVDKGRPARLLHEFTSTVEDEYTIVFTLQQPFPDFLNTLTHAWAAIPSKAAYEEYGKEYGLEYIAGTGPFMFVSWELGSKIVLVKNPDYWQYPVKLDRLEWIVIPDASTRALALESGEVDFVYGLPAHEFPRLVQDPGIEAVTGVTVRTVYLCSNVQRPPLDDKNVRQAMAHAIDSRVLVENLMDGIGEIPVALAFPKLFGITTEVAPLSYDLEKANALLEASGWIMEDDKFRYKDDQKLRLQFYLSTIEGYYPRAVVQAIQAQLKVVGFDVELLFLENAAFLATIPQGRQQLFLWSYGPAGGDAHVFLYPHFHSSGGRNYTFYSDSEVDSLLDEASITLDPQEREQIYRELQEHLMGAAIMSPIYLVEDTFAYTPKVIGFEPHPRQHLLFGQVDIVDPYP